MQPVHCDYEKKETVPVIPAKAVIQKLQVLTKTLGTGVTSSQGTGKSF